MTIEKVKTQASDIVERTLTKCKRYGADEAAVSVNGGCSGLTRFALNRIIQNVESNKHTLTIAVSVDNREAGVTTSVMDDNAIDQAVQDVIKSAKMYPENPEHVSPVKPVSLPDSDCYDPNTADFPQIDKAQTIKRICSKTETSNLMAYGILKTGWKYEAYGNSNGHFCWHPESIADFSLTARTTKGDGSCRENRTYNRFEKIDFDALIDKCCSWAILSQTAEYIDPGDYTVILTPTAAMNYLMWAFFTMDARKVAEGRSALSNYFKLENPLNQKLFSSNINVFSRLQHPEYPAAPFGSAFEMDYGAQGLASGLFSRGLPVEDYPIIQNGVQKHLFSSLYWARKNNVEPRAFPTMMEFSGTDQSLEQIIAASEKALLINSFWYIRFVDPNQLLLTGLTRDGVFMVENGKISRPVKNLRFNESPLLSLENVQCVGKPEARRSWFFELLIPPMVVENFSFTTETDAI
jgi:predicted Zn-dependent protease